MLRFVRNQFLVLMVAQIHLLPWNLWEAIWWVVAIWFANMRKDQLFILLTTWIWRYYLFIYSEKLNKLTIFTFDGEFELKKSNIVGIICTGGGATSLWIIWTYGQEDECFCK